MTDQIPYWPAAMDLKSAAAYCGVCVETFKKVCPVRPLKFTQSTRGERYLRQRLDEWLASIDPNKQSSSPRKSMVEMIYGGHRESHRA